MCSFLANFTSGLHFPWFQQVCKIWEPTEKIKIIKHCHQIKKLHHFSSMEHAPIIVDYAYKFLLLISSSQMHFQVTHLWHKNDVIHSENYI